MLTLCKLMDLERVAGSGRRCFGVLCDEEHGRSSAGFLLQPLGTVRWAHHLLYPRVRLVVASMWMA